ncbi:MAG: hypothetical protein FJ313_05285, partial [Gemmatimonadetes bacterium]|nr:hypothetical protein [Gemmatimonadota bacterium]
MCTAGADYGDQPVISLAADEAGRPQPVEVTVRGLRYPGEVVVTRFWAARLGEPLRGHAMFRLVLLTEACAVAPAEIQDRRIAVAVPSSAGDAGLERLNTEARALQETRARYAVAADPGLDRL